MQVEQEAARDLLVGLAQQRGRLLPTGEQHQAAAGTPWAAGAKRMRLVGEHVEDPARCGHRVDVVVRHRRRLARLDRHAQERAVGDPLQRCGGLRGDGRDERSRERRLHRDDDLAGTRPRRDAVGQVLDEQRVAVLTQPRHPGARAGAVAELASHGRGQLTGPADQVARDQGALAAPDEREQADATARGELVELRRRPMRRAREDALDGSRQRAEELPERALVLVSEHPRAGLLRPLPRPRLRDAVVLRHRPLDLHAGGGERHTLADRQREPERIASPRDRG